MFLHKPPIKDLPPLKAKTSDVGRFYTNLETYESYPSITTVLGAQSKQGILEWKKRVGEDVANHISNQAATRGTAVHNMVEDHLNNINVDEVEKYKKQFLPRMMFNVLKPELIKTSTKEKSEDWIENYFVQGSAYSQMYKEHFGEEVTQVVILITTEQGTTQVFKKNPYDYLEKLKQYVEEFYKTLP